MMDIQNFYDKKNRKNIDSDLSDSPHDISISDDRENKYVLDDDDATSNNYDTSKSRSI